MVLENKPNRLISEKSPYLIQHASNPVDWYPWSDEAFEKAATEDKPIFLSIGYSTCHWCHNMARESFQNEGVSAILNSHFVSIKVDREERFDIDSVYMTFCQAISGHGGWPISIFMTPDKKPFYAGTYFSRDDIRGVAGFRTILLSIQKMWEEDREKLIDASEEVLDIVKNNLAPVLPKKLGEDDVEKAFFEFRDSYDPANGGFGSKPKFPMGHAISYLLEYYDYTGDEVALVMAEESLRAIYRGGIYDHLGGGFARYAVDEKWAVPHFEKMLYDNGFLLSAYIKLYDTTGNPIYKKIAEDTIDFLNREMKSDTGGYYAGIDADSEGREGKFYTWDKGELRRILSEEKYQILKKHYYVNEAGDLEDRIILNRIGKRISIEDFSETEEILSELFDYRENRVKPSVDRKIITSWNAALAKALLAAGALFEYESYTEQGLELIEFIEKNLVVDGRIMARRIDGETKYLGYIQDYSYCVNALLTAYEVTGCEAYLDSAKDYAEDMRCLFEDKENGGFFLSGNDAEALIVRPKEANDGALPSGNSTAAMALIKLGYLMEDEEFIALGKKTLDSVGKEIENAYIYHAEAVRALLLYCRVKE